MPAKYKDYPIYTYDEPVTYSDFSGGINTDPSNEHLGANEMRDCLNMHYKSAALVKRKGASLLCTIACEDELFNIQGIFIFTYKITYIIIAADGKLYQGVYSTNSTIKLERLKISIETDLTYQLYNPKDMTVGLETFYEELINIQHEGFVHRYLIDSSGNRISPEHYTSIGDFLSLPNGYTFNSNDMVEYDQRFWILKEKLPISEDILEDIKVKKTIIYPGIDLFEEEDREEYWLPYSEFIEKYPGVQLDTYHYLPWSLHTRLFNRHQVVSHLGELYVCTTEHNPILNAPSSSWMHSYYKWEQCGYKQELVFQNHLPIEGATYNNKLYLTTGTRFVQVAIINNIITASVVSPYLCNSSEITNIGYNFLSPYPELCSTTQYNQVITSITGLLALEQQSGEYILTPQMNFAGTETESDYFFKWEKKISDEWVTLIRFKDNLLDDTTKIDRFTLTVNDANKYQYRVTFAKSFDKPVGIIPQWVYDTDMYKVGDKVSVKESDTSKEKIYECIKEHCPKKLIWGDGSEIPYTTEYIINKNYSKDYYIKQFVKSEEGYFTPTITPTFFTHTYSISGINLYEKDDDDYTYISPASIDESVQLGQMYWKEINIEEELLYKEPNSDKIIKSSDWAIDKIDGEYFGQASSLLAQKLIPEDTFNIIHSCRKIASDGNKFLLYGDRFNSGSWYKTIINNPSYITYRGGLSFKTTKNEELIKVTPFNGTLIAFANSENVGGSIHLVTGNGDDWDDQSGYYSPYKRATINNSISCDNENTVQVCENLLVFKYFDTLYYISSSELSNEVVSVYSCNDKLKHDNNFVKIPWDDNSCISEVTEDYYALIWKEKYYIEDDDLIQERPAIKIKMYYKLGYQDHEKICFPWLKDESEYFNISKITYIKGKPIYLYNNTLITFDNNVYTDFDKPYKCFIHFRGEDINYPKLYKLIDSVIVYYHHNQYSNIDFNVLVKNEAGHILLDNSSKRFSLQDLRALRSGDKLEDSKIRLDSTILDSRVYNTAYKFPCLLADTIIEATNDKEFSLSSITYNYTTSDTPDTTAYDLYSNIIRPKEVK